MRTRLTSLAVTAAVLGGIAATGIATTGSTASAASPPPPSAPADAALSWIERELTNNGGRLPSSVDPTSPDWGLTIDAVLALNGGGPGTGAAAPAATTALAAPITDSIPGAPFGDPGTFAGPVGKSLVAATLQGADVHAFGGVDLEAKSRAAMVTSGVHAGRFSDQGSNFGDFSNEFGQALNVLGLSHTAAGVPAPAVEFLLAQQCPNGSFRLDFDTPPLTRGCTTDAAADSDATAFSLQALLSLSPTPPILAAEQKAADWLASIQDAATGGFGGTGPTAALNASTTGLASQVLRALGRTTAAARGEAYVTALQLTAANPGGPPAAADEGAIANTPGSLAAALSSGIAAVTRDQWRRATTQGVLAFGAPLWGEPVTAVVPVDP